MSAPKKARDEGVRPSGADQRPLNIRHDYEGKKGGFLFL